MPRSKEEFQNLRSKKIELIREAALTCFATKGFQNTTMADIAKKAGISTGLSYNYFSSKEEILKFLYLHGIEDVFAPLKSYETPMTKENMIHFIHHIFKALKQNSRFWKLYFGIMTQPDIITNYSDYMMESAQLYLSSLTSFFQAKGYSDADTETRYFMSVIDGVCLNFLSDPEHYPLLLIEQKIINEYAK